MSAAMTVPDRPRPVRRWPSALLVVALVLGGLLAAVVVVLAAATLPPSGTNLFTMVAPYAWVVAGPHLVLVAVLVLVLGVVAIVRRRRRLGAVVTAVALVATIWSGGIVGSIVHATDAAGGSIDLVSAMAPGSMDAANDGTRLVETVGGTRLSATVYRPAGSARRAPVMMYIHGGGWITGAAGELGYDMRWFADHGWLVVSVDYRLATATHATWDEAPEDVACALVWTARNAASLGGDPGRLVVSGDSAGGNLAVNLADAAAQHTATSGCAGTVPAAVVTQYPVVDPLDASDHGFPSPGFEPKVFTADYLGGAPQAHPDRLAAISSSTYVTTDSPRTLVVEPEHDGLIPAAGVEAWVRHAQAQGAPVTMVTVPFANHTFNQLASHSLGNQAGLTIEEHVLTRWGLAP